MGWRTHDVRIRLHRIIPEWTGFHRKLPTLQFTIYSPMLNVLGRRTALLTGFEVGGTIGIPLGLNPLLLLLVVSLLLVPGRPVYDVT